VKGIAVKIRINGNGRDAHLAASPNYPDRYLSAVGDEDLLQHAAPFSLRSPQICTDSRVFAMWDVRWFESIDSTNTYLLTQAAEGALEGTVAVADFQSAGRGRLDRKWEAPPGQSLLASILFRPTFDPAELHLCTSAVALAAAEACRKVAGVGPVLKWPNDLLVGENKLAGVLAEVNFDGPGCAVVVGIGINVSWPGPSSVQSTCLNDLCKETVDRQVLLEALLQALEPRRALLDTPIGRQELAAEVRNRCATLGQRIRVELASEAIDGVASEIDDAGHLIVQTTEGPRTVAVGDVVHLRPN
jgi:BirA family biotin operon repressor/biotin-[acetyl-CoA-carboxylase] ligase